MTNEASSGGAESRALSTNQLVGLALIAAGTYQNAAHAAFLAAMQVRDVALSMITDVEDSALMLDALDEASREARRVLTEMRTAMERAKSSALADAVEAFVPATLEAVA